jgi:hypothetical protein
MHRRLCRRPFLRSVLRRQSIRNTVFESKDIERLVAAYEQTLRALRLKDLFNSQPANRDHLLGDKLRDPG